jgi:tryptophan synthase alpha chain
MSRLEKHFASLKKQNRKALIPFVTAGDPDPDPDMTVSVMHAMVTAGADIIELGVPFSDPMAEGPVIQKASERAVARGVSLRDCMDMVQEFRQTNNVTPVILMGYLNPVEAMGYKKFAKAAAKAGVDGVLTVDMPPEEAADLVAALGEYNLDPIFLLAPTSTEQRILSVNSVASGFIYYVSLRGVTGAKLMDMSEVADRIGKIRKYTQLPLAVGFGINDPESAAQVAQLADAVVVGSALVKRIENAFNQAKNDEQKEAILESVTDFVSSLRKAMDKVGVAA